MAEPTRTPEFLPPKSDGVLTPEAVTGVGRVELREERAFVEKRRERSGHVDIRREVERRSVVLSAELIAETLVIERRPGSGVFIDGEPLMEGETREILTYREEAGISKQTVVSEEVRIGKRQVSERRTFEVALNREVLDVRQTEVAAPAPKVEP